MRFPLVSAIIPAYNAQDYLKTAINSAFEQSYPNIEIIVVNDGSTDSTGTIADAFASKFPGKVKVVHQENGGLCAARNSAIRHAKGEFFALLDADDEWLPHHIQSSVDAFARHPMAALVHSNVELMDRSGKGLGTPENKWQGASDANPWLEIFLRREHVLCPTAVFKRHSTDDQNYFDAHFNRLGCEDRDLWLRIASNYDLVYLDNVHARYRLHAGNMSKQSHKMLEARLRLIAKHAYRAPEYEDQALAAVYIEHADALLEGNSYLAAFIASLEALAHSPRWARPWKFPGKMLRHSLKSLLKNQ